MKLPFHAHLNRLHWFSKSIAHIALPEKFTYPFHYTPHPLSLMAAEEVQTYLVEKTEWQKELQAGKMFGVLVVQTKRGEIGYLAAFSGILAGKNLHPFFVPPVYDLQEPNGFFGIEEEQISAINTRIKQLQEEKRYTDSKQRLSEEATLAAQAIEEATQQSKAAREIRQAQRENLPDEAELAAMVRESQYQKAELKRLKQYWNNRIAALQAETEAFETQIEELKTARKTRSASLQQQLFEQFQMLNNRREKKDLCNIFRETAQKTPPAGAGECAAPKLLQYAYLNEWQPLAMAEFWWGDSPKCEIRRHGYYYPACKGKCEPILQHMLQGLQVDNNPLQSNPHCETDLPVLYEDEWLLVVDKPAGLLSVPGNMDLDTVFQRIKTRYPEATGPLLVHRLDMATSGLLLIAKSKEVHQHLQAQFKNRTIQKRYIALLDGLAKQDEGIISLPLRPDPTDRPRQVVDEVAGKPATTTYQVLARQSNQTRIAFFPLTGRTHQLRVHAAHPLGLNLPICGDELYGKKADRLYLHAEQLTFLHPITGKTIEIESQPCF